MPENGSLIGYQQHLFALPTRQPLAVAEWRQMQRMGMERRHQKFSRSSRAEALRYYRRVFTDDDKRESGADGAGRRNDEHTR